MLCSFPASYITFKDTILYSRDILIIDRDYNALYFREKIKQPVIGCQAEGLVARERDSCVHEWERSMANESDIVCYTARIRGTRRRIA